MPFFGATPFAAPGLGLIASLVMLAFGMWWLKRAETKARLAGERFGPDDAGAAEDAAEDPIVRERASTAREFDPAEIYRSDPAERGPPIVLATLPIVVVIFVNLLMSFVILTSSSVSFLTAALTSFGAWTKVRSTS